MIIYKQVCESLEKTENEGFDERKLGQKQVRKEELGVGGKAGLSMRKLGIRN